MMRQSKANRFFVKTEVTAFITVKLELLPHRRSLSTASTHSQLV